MRGVRVEAKHLGRLEEHEGSGWLTKELALSRTLKRLVELGQAEVGEGASGRRSPVNDSLRARGLIWLLCGTQEAGVVGWDYGSETLVARLRRGVSARAELHSRNPMFWW